MSKRIAVFTSFMHHRGGDLISAVSFMKAVLSQDTDVEFEWIIKRDLSGFQKDIEALKRAEMGAWHDKVHVTCLNSEDYEQVTIVGNQVFDKYTHLELSRQEITDRSEYNWGNLIIGWNGWRDTHERLASAEISARINACDMMVVCANPHRMLEEDYHLLATFNKPTRLIPEYDLEHDGCSTHGNPNVEVIHTGFGGTNYSGSYKDTRGQGVYIDDSVLANNGLDDVAAGDANFVGYLTANNLSAYQQTHTLFYGYFFDIQQHVLSHYVVTTAAYLTNSIMLAMDSMPDKPNIDFVIPGYKDPELLRQVYQQALYNLPEAYKSKIKLATYDLKQGDVFTPTLAMASEGPYSVRLINPQRLERKTVQALLNDSDPWVGLTGDASWIEGLIKGKIVCYQVVRWKEHFFRGFLKYLEQKLPASPLTDFYKAQRASNFNLMRALYQTSLPQMQEDAQRLAQYFIQEKNLATNIVPRILHDLGSPLATSQLMRGASLATEDDESQTELEGDMEASRLEQFIDRIREYLEVTTIQNTKLTFWSDVRLLPMDTLRTALKTASSLEQVCEALTGYYHSVSESSSSARGHPDKEQFEHFMLRLGVIESKTECPILEEKLQALPQAGIAHLQLQPISRLHILSAK